MKKSQSFFKDAAWYAFGAVIPMLLNLLKTPIFTRHYSTEDFGYLGLVMTTFGYLSVVSFSWLASCIWRYYNTFKKKKTLGILYSNILFLYVLSVALTLIISVVLIVLAQYQEFNSLIVELVVLAFLHFCIKELLGLYMIIVRLKGQAKTYNLLLIVQVVFGFGLLMVLAFVCDMSIASIMLSSIVIDSILMFFVLVYLAKNKKLQLLSTKLISRRIINIFGRFGSLTLLSSIFLMLIVTSDRYIIALYDTMSNVGIYTKVYDIAQLSIMALIFVYFSAINPKMNQELTHNFKQADDLLAKYLYAFIFIGLPLTGLASVYAKEIAEILLGEAFREGFIIMPSIFFSVFIYGILRFTENKLKFANKNAHIAWVYALSFVLNLVLNFMFVPRYGYVAAAYSTLVAYGFMLLCFFKIDSLTFFNRKDFMRTIFQVVFMTFLFGLIDYKLRTFVKFNLVYAAVEATLFVGIFILLFYKKLRQLEIPVN